MKLINIFGFIGLSFLGLTFLPTLVILGLSGLPLFLLLGVPILFIKFKGI